jgi:hypothetical protein
VVMLSIRLNIVIRCSTSVVCRCLKGVVCEVLLCACIRIAPALLRQATYGTIKLGCYNIFKRTMAEKPEGLPLV